MPRHIPKLYKHTQLIEKEVAGVIDHNDLSVTDGKLASGVGLLDTQICKLPVAVADKVLKRGAKEWEAGDVPAAPSPINIGGFEGTGSGTQQITGVGFQPKLVIFFAIDMYSPPRGRSWGFDDATNHRCTWVAGDISYVDGDDAASIYVHRDIDNYRRGAISSMDSDGFTITWDLTGDVTARVQYLAIG